VAVGRDNGPMNGARRLNPHEERALAVRAGCDPRSVRVYLDSHSQRSTVAARIADALRALGRHGSSWELDLSPHETRARGFRLLAQGYALLAEAEVCIEGGSARESLVSFAEAGVRVNIRIMRAFVRLRAMLAGNADLAPKLAALERKYDAQFKIVFDALRELMAPPPNPRRPIGFRS
jgi:hypothetical protein